MCALQVHTIYNKHTQHAALFFRQTHSMRTKRRGASGDETDDSHAMPISMSLMNVDSRRIRSNSKIGPWWKSRAHLTVLLLRSSAACKPFSEGFSLRGQIIAAHTKSQEYTRRKEKLWKNWIFAVEPHKQVTRFKTGSRASYTQNHAVPFMEIKRATRIKCT